MSGITGVFNRDGRPVSRGDLERMGETLAHRGPDGSGAWSGGPAGLGHLMLHSTPESLNEKLPLAGFGGELVITADARIDNRDELISSLDLNSRPSQEITDSELILHAYERWGEDCPRKLDGDFAFAIWDKRRQLMFCARDHFGMKPFYYHMSGNLFAIGSEIKALLALADVPRRINETRIGDFCANIIEDKEITFYKDILRLPPASCLAVSREGVRLWSYWSPDPSRRLRLSSDKEYGEAYREVFTEAVRCRLRSALPVGSTLSGGLDSSSIVCVSRELLKAAGNGGLHTFSVIFDEPRADERPYMNAVLAGGDLIPHDVFGRESSPFTDLERLLWHLDQPSFGTNLYIFWSIATSAQQQGVRVLLDGAFGDATVSWGFGWMSELARKGRWLALNREAKAIARIANVRKKDVLERFAVRPVKEDVQRVWYGLRGRNGNGWTPDPIINPDFARRVGLKERWHTVQAGHARAPRSSREEHWLSLTTGLIPLGLELSEAVSAAFRIDWRGPFLDRRLAEFCLSLPGEQKLQNGFTRAIARHGLVNILPEKVRLRRDKGDLSESLLRSFVENRERLEQTAFGEGNGLCEYLNPDGLRSAYQRFAETPNSGDGSTLFKAAALATWLKKTQLTPQSQNERR
jgi:asparagine synthase (glutamine-hydrolysing)